MSSGAPLSTRLGPRQWMAIDATVAVAICAVLVGVAVSRRLHPAGEERMLAMLLLAGPASLPLAVRRRWPVPVFFVVLAASVAYSVFGPKISPVAGPVYALYMVALQSGRTWSLLALAAAEAAALVNGASAGIGVNVALRVTATGKPASAAVTALVILIVWIAADSIRRHRAYTVSLRERSLREALSEQRLQIARELHDIVAHALSVVAVQAGVGSHLIATRPDEAAKSLAAIEATARTALSETRSLLSVMRDAGHDPAGMSPLPGLGDLRALVQRVSDAGQPVTLRVEGQPRPLSKSLELSVYRVVQEALTNVVKHAAPPVTATVVIRYDDGGDVIVDVADDGHGAPNRRGDGGGHGLAGMRERVSLLGGELSAGPRAAGGYQVVARLPAGIRAP